MQEIKSNEARVKVEIATSINFGNYKKWKPVSNQLSNFIKLNWKKISQEYKLPGFLTIKIRPIKGTWVGWARQSADGTDYSIEIDPRRDLTRQALETLFHELTHIDQYVTGRLKHKHGARIWCGSMVPDLKVHQVHSSQKNLDKYRNQPWEVEARARGAELSEKYWEQFQQLRNRPSFRI